jgi:hypothetical protein
MDQDDNRQTGTVRVREAGMDTESPSEEALLPSPQRVSRSVRRSDGRSKCERTAYRRMSAVEVSKTQVQPVSLQTRRSVLPASARW